MASQTYQLVMQKGPTPGKIFEFGQDELTIGRDITNRIVINDPEVSRKHVRLILQSGSYVIEDLGSTNGTFVDGQRLIGPHVLRPGETVMLGEKISMQYEVLGFDPNATMVSGASPVTRPQPGSRETYRVEPGDYSAQPMQPQQPGYYEPPAPAPYQAPQPAYQPPPAPVYSGNVPPGPAEVYGPPADLYDEIPEQPVRRKSKTWLYVLIGVVLVILCCLVVGAFAFDSMNLYCTPPFDTFFACP